MKKVFVIALIIGAVGIVGAKGNRTRECRVAWVDGTEIAVIHPNGKVYQYELDKTDLNNYSEDEIIKVVFDEMYDWETQYTIKGIK